MERCRTPGPSRAAHTSAPALLLGLLLLGLCAGQTVSPTRSPSPSPTRSATPPCSAAPGYFCSGGTPLICPIGAYCAGGAAPNVSCYPMTACSVAGLDAQPLCYWNVSTLAGSGSTGCIDGFGTAATFNGPIGVSLDPVTGGVFASVYGCNSVRRITPSGLVTTYATALNGPHGIPIDSQGDMYVVDTANRRIRKFLSNGTAFTFAGSGVAGGANGIGTAAQFSFPTDIALDSSGAMGYVVEQDNGHRIRSVVMSTGSVSLLAGGAAAGFADDVGVAARFNRPTSAVWHPSGTLYVADGLENHRIRSVFIASATVTTLAGNGIAGGLNGIGTSATFNHPRGITLDATFSILYVAEQTGHRIRSINVQSALVKTVAGSGVAGYGDFFGVAAVFNGPLFLAFSPFGILYTAEVLGHRIRQLTCVSCPASYYCSSGAPVLCPPGSYCPLSSINATLCPSGAFSSAGAANCTPCAPGTFSPAPGSTACQICPNGHYCPAGTSSWARLNCGRGNYCPSGSGAPAPCPVQLPPSGGWGALQVQGPAFLVETASCLNLCFWNFTSGDGALSRC